MDIKGRVGMVTAAGAAGTGRAIALRLAREGAAVVATDIDAAGGEETVRRIQAEGGRAAFVRADMRVPDDVEAMVDFATEAFRGLDILVNNAGWTDEPHFPHGSLAHWGGTLDLNLRAPMLASQLAIQAMTRRGGGAIVNISSVAGIGYRPHDSPEYAAAKAGLIRFTATLAPLKDQLNVRVNCVVPHWIATEHAEGEARRAEDVEPGLVPHDPRPGRQDRGFHV